MNVLELENLSVTYGNGFCAANNVSFAIKAGECLALVGASGSGKTTIGRAILGLLPAGTKISGSIKVLDTEAINASNQALRSLRGLVVGFVDQNPFAACNPLARVKTHVTEAWRAHGSYPPQNAVIDSLERLGIENAKDSAEKFPHQWSGGMLQRATIAAASAHKPRLIIADEPTSALDTNRADSTIAALRSTGAAVLLISHDFNLVARHADRIAVCNDGQIIEVGNTPEILNDPQNQNTRTLLSHSVPDSEIPITQNLANAEIVLEGKNLSRVYKHGGTTVRAVAQADLQVRRGEIVGIYGDSGSGKSTLLRLLAGIEAPTTGEVSFAGKQTVTGGFAMPVFQDPVGSLDSRWAVWRAVAEPLTASHRKKAYSRQELREVARTALAEVGLAEIDLEARPSELSVGQCQRVCIARALVAEPALILADEPTSALDSSVGQQVLKLLKEIALRGTAIVIVSHNKPMLDAFSHRVLLMCKGILKDGVE